VPAADVDDEDARARDPHVPHFDAHENLACPAEPSRRAGRARAA